VKHGLLHRKSRLAVIDTRLLRRLSEPKREEGIGERRGLHNEEFHKPARVETVSGHQ
jgi:hypothetical protein